MDLQKLYDEQEPKFQDLMKELDLEWDDNNGGGSGDDNNDQPNNESNTDSQGDKDDKGQQGGAGGSGEGEPEDTDGNSEGGDVNEANGNGSGSGKGQPLEEMSDKQKKQLQKALEKQRQFMAGDVQKTKMNKKDKKMIEAIEHSDASIENVQAGSWGGNVDVVVIRKINEHNRGVCDMYGAYGGGSYGITDEVIANGFRLGTMLGKKLRVRNDDIRTTYNRQRRGGIDRRLLAELGVGNTKIFEKSFVTVANDAGIHISIDASGSMGGERIKNATTTAIAIAKAADMVGGIRVRIDFRSDCSSIINNRNWGGPTVMVVYDSKTQTLNHIKKNFPYLRCGGGTPEGLCFQAIKDIITQGGKTTDRYFINMSDGCPSGHAIDPTRKAVKDFKVSGMKVMSYFIGSRVGDSTKTTFDGMYGTDSTEYVDTTNIVQIAKTLNKLLSERG